jgi:hypothetical protein
MKKQLTAAVLAVGLALGAVGCGSGSHVDASQQSAFNASMTPVVGSHADFVEIGAAACQMLDQTHGDRLKVDAAIVATDSNPVTFHAAVKSAAYTICPKYQLAVALW